MCTLVDLISKMIILASEKNQIYLYIIYTSAAPLCSKSCTWLLFLDRIPDNFGVIPVEGNNANRISV